MVGLMGSMLSGYKADLLGTRFDRVALMLDGDEAGRVGAMLSLNATARRSDGPSRARGRHQVCL